MDALARQAQLVDALARVLGTGASGRFETHISWVLVAGGHAYKFKKALRLPFLDCSTLAARRFYCMEELRLNRRLAPGLYIDVVPVAGDAAHPVLGGTGEAIEYAVRMHAFEQEALWPFRIAHGLAGAVEADALAATLAQFHQGAPAAAPHSPWGSPAGVAAAFRATLAELAGLLAGNPAQAKVRALERWEAAQRARIGAGFARRKALGMIRECHGDLHCGNVLTLGGEVQAFDCIEFSDSLRWIDVIDDIAFIHMDLGFHGRDDLAARLLSEYLERTGDYSGLAVLSFYRVHRALVRAKVMLLRAGQPGTPPSVQAGCRREGLSYLRHGVRCARPGRAAIMVTHGFSGSGKSSLARLLVEVLGAVRLRSDVERKRLTGGEPGAAPCHARYGEAATQRTYERLAEHARTAAAAGWPVVVDAACLRSAQRASFRALASELSLPFFIFDLHAPRTIMAQRIVARQASGLDASEADLAVLDRQVRSAEPLTGQERAQAIVVDTGAGISLARASEACAPVLAALGRPAPGRRAPGPALRRSSNERSHAR